MKLNLVPSHIRAIGHVKGMRGGAQSHLLICDDGHRYVVKFQNNPKGTRILANEWIAAAVFHHFGIPAPPVPAILLDGSFLASQPEVCFHLGSHFVPVQPGIHFGSRYVGNDRYEPFDFLPDTVLDLVDNRRDFIPTLIVDKWLENADSRQCVFVKGPGHNFKVWMIDHGYILSGPHWSLGDVGDRSGLYSRPMVYSTITDTTSLEPWLTTIEHCPFRVFSDALDSMPAEWLTPCDTERLHLSLRQIWNRRRSLRNRLAEVCEHLPQQFAGWQTIPAA